MLGWKAYVIALLLCFITAVFRVHFDDHLIGATYLPFFPALIIGTYIGGFWPGVVQSIIIGLVNLYFFIPPTRTLVFDTSTAITLGLYSLIALFVVWSVHTLRTTLVIVEQGRKQNAVLAKKRETLLRELQHRVKNNLQLVSSLLILQKSQVHDQSARKGLEEASRRIAILSSIHHDLYRLDGTKVSLRDLIGRIISFAQTDLTHPNAVRCEFDDVPLSPREAIPLGLITNELVANAVEHGIIGDGGDRVVVSYRVEGRVHTLSVADNGPGFPETVDPNMPTSFGLTIVQALAAQIYARLSFQSHPGVGSTVVLTFEPPDSDDEEVRFDSSS